MNSCRGSTKPKEKSKTDNDEGWARKRNKGKHDNNGGRIKDIRFFKTKLYGFFKSLKV